MERRGRARSEECNYMPCGCGRDASTAQMEVSRFRKRSWTSRRPLYDTLCNACTVKFKSMDYNLVFNQTTRLVLHVIDQWRLNNRFWGGFSIHSGRDSLKVVMSALDGGEPQRVAAHDAAGGSGGRAEWRTLEHSFAAGEQRDPLCANDWMFMLYDALHSSQYHNKKEVNTNRRGKWIFASWRQLLKLICSINGWFGKMQSESTLKANKELLK